MGDPVEQELMLDHIVLFPHKRPPAHSCWQRLIGINVLNLYRVLEQKGDYDAMQWLEDIQVDDYVVEVSSLPCPHRDRERIGKVISTSCQSVIIETDDGQRIKWINGKLLKIPETVIY